MAVFTSAYKPLAHGALNWDTQLRTDMGNLETVLNKLDQAWTPNVTGRTVSSVLGARVAQVGGIVLATANFKMNGPIADGMALFLPITSASLPGLVVSVGEVEFISSQDGYTVWRGRLLSSNSAADRASFAVDVASGRNNQVAPTAVSPSTNAPFPTAATGDFFVSVRLQYPA
jgi:hypothetical protein